MKTKSILLSKTIWGIVMFIAPLILKWCGVDILPYVNDGSISVSEIIQLLGVVLATYGRLKANTVLSIIKK